jgi:hypothetical protein
MPGDDERRFDRRLAADGGRRPRQRVGPEAKDPTQRIRPALQARVSHPREKDSRQLGK